MSATAPRPAPVRPRRPAAGLYTAVGIMLAVAALYFGRELFAPFALAILLGFALAPIVDAMRRRRVPKLVAIGVAVVFAFVIVAAIALFVGTQVVQVAGELPSYQMTMARKIEALRASAEGSGLLSRLGRMIETLGEALTGPGSRLEEAARATAGRTPESEPIPVTVEPAQPKPMDVLRAVAGPILGRLATAGIVVVFVIFILVEREELRDRFIRLIGADDLPRSTQALDDAARRVSRYLLLQLTVNVSYGVPLGVGLWLIGVPNAALWGTLATVLRFIPYLGPILAAFFPLTLALAVDPGWTMFLYAGAFILVIELVSNNLVEPVLYGSKTGLSSTAIIFTAVFWTILWGPAGLFLSTPLTVFLVSVGRHVPSFEFLGLLLGSDPALSPAQRFYQRLLSGNVEEAVDMAETALAESRGRDGSNPSSGPAGSSAERALAFYDDVVLPALRLAEDDWRREAGEEEHCRRVADTALAVVREVGAILAERREETPPDSPEDPVVGVTWRSELDEATVEMLVQLLGERGFAARRLPPAVPSPTDDETEGTGVALLCLCHLNPRPEAFARYLARRLKRREPDLSILLCAWNGDGRVERERAGVGAVVHDLSAALAEIEARVPSLLAGRAGDHAGDCERAT